MGSLSWSPQPSGPQLLTPHHINKLSPQPSGPPHITPHQLTKMGPGTVFHPIILIASALSLDTDRSVVKYLGDTFLLPDGCPVNDPMVQRFYKLCLESHQNAPLCTKERLSRTQVLTIPYVTNVCSAICHGMDETKTTTCPHRARTIIPYTASNRGVPLLQSSKPDTTFQFGQVLDRTFG